jgi:hypothetical protein
VRGRRLAETGLTERRAPFDAPPRRALPGGMGSRPRTRPGRLWRARHADQFCRATDPGGRARRDATPDRCTRRRDGQGSHARDRCRRQGLPSPAHARPRRPRRPHRQRIVSRGGGTRQRSLTLPGRQGRLPHLLPRRCQGPCRPWHCGERADARRRRHTDGRPPASLR